MFEFIIPAVASIFGASSSKKAANRAADAQVQATQDANKLQKDIADQQIGLAREQFDFAKGAAKPGMQAGTAATNKLASLLGLRPESGTPGSMEAIRNRLRPQFTDTSVPGSIWEKTPELEAAVQAEARRLQEQGDPNDPEFGLFTKNFDPSTVEMDPGYAWRRDQGAKTILRGLGRQAGDGRALRGLEEFGQGLASQEYGNAYSRAFNRFQTDRANRLQPLQSMAGYGQSSTNSLMGAGQNFASGAGNALGNYGQQAGANITGAGNARASSYVGGANALNQGIGQGYNMWQGNQYLQAYRDRNNGGGNAGYGVPQNPFAGAPMGSYGNASGPDMDIYYRD
jgi:hypothetical protein